MRFNTKWKWADSQLCRASFSIYTNQIKQIQFAKINPTRSFYRFHLKVCQNDIRNAYAKAALNCISTLSISNGITLALSNAQLNALQCTALKMELYLWLYKSKFKRNFELRHNNNNNSNKIMGAAFCSLSLLTVNSESVRTATAMECKQKNDNFENEFNIFAENIFIYWENVAPNELRVAWIQYYSWMASMHITFEQKNRNIDLAANKSRIANEKKKN